jgi:hypothetical protein
MVVGKNDEAEAVGAVNGHHEVNPSLLGFQSRLIMARLDATHPGHSTVGARAADFFPTPGLPYAGCTAEAFGAAKAQIAQDAVSRFAARPVPEIGEIGKVSP